MALVIVLIIGVLVLAYLPQWWVKRVIDRHSAERADFAGTGGEFARYLLNGVKLHDVRVEETQDGDHYDPEAKAVRLLPQQFNGRSLSAVVIAAHEVGHAIQDATGYAPLQARTRLAKQGEVIQRVGFMVLLAAPLMMLVFRHPAAIFLELGAGLIILSLTILMHVFTLPVEFDASFARAMPLLREGRLLPEKDLPAARQILTAAALTYVAAAALSLLDVMRWLRVLRF
ncbi:MAG: zinc metallopeptidase [Hyphomicrobiaceae bacterium]|nr:zinc metallopeptidase [Hyphomicrobiaceae bacterium]